MIQKECSIIGQTATALRLFHKICYEKESFVSVDSSTNDIITWGGYGVRGGRPDQTRTTNRHRKRREQLGPGYHHISSSLGPILTGTDISPHRRRTAKVRPSVLTAIPNWSPFVAAQNRH